MPYPLVLALPGSRRGEVARLAPVIGATLARIVKIFPTLRVVLPTVPHVSGLVEGLVADWPVQPQIVFKIARLNCGLIIGLLIDKMKRISNPLFNY